MLLLRALTRLVALALFAALALAGLAAAIFAIGSGHGSFSLPGLLRAVHAPALRDDVVRLLGGLERHGPTASASLLGGAATVVTGLGLLVGALAPRRERLVTLETAEDGSLLARRRALARLVTTLVDQAREVMGARTRVVPRRRRAGARLHIRVDRAKRRPATDVRTAALQRLEPMTSTLPLRPRIRSRVTKGVE